MHTICTLLLCFTHFSLQLYFWWPLLHLPHLDLHLHSAHFHHTAQLLLICCTLLYILLYTWLSDSLYHFSYRYYIITYRELNLRIAWWWWLYRLSNFPLPCLVLAAPCCTSSAYITISIRYQLVITHYTSPQRRHSIRLPRSRRVLAASLRIRKRFLFSVHQRRLYVCRSSLLSS